LATPPTCHMQRTKLKHLMIKTEAAGDARPNHCNNWGYQGSMHASILQHGALDMATAHQQSIDCGSILQHGQTRLYQT
jgi:hypothetical protein